jgi:hypothetical protein
MTVNQLKESEEFNTFVAYLKGIWLGKIDFQFNLRYAKQPKRCDNFKSLNKIKYTYKGKDLLINNQLLVDCEILINKGIQSKDTSQVLAGIQNILRWGDSINYIKNLDFFKKKNDDGALLEYINYIKNKWYSILDEELEFSQESDFDIKSAAGNSKIYSVILKDFIIYDSRVAAALAYLLKSCFEIKNRRDIPLDFELFLLPYRDNKDKPTYKRDVYPFCTIQDNNKLHFYSNILASLIVKSAVVEINKESDQKITTRDFEAALFMIGYDVSNQP